jgi:beta-galactosidase/beta-glucuronidase
MKRQYPRPQLQRKEWIDLNGYWDFAFDDAGVGVEEKWYLNKTYDKQILITFPYQSKLSEIHDLSVHDHVWYHKTLYLKHKEGQRVLLHFGAIDYQATIYLNGLLIASHTGGSTSFSVDITTYVEMTNIQDITIHVYDPSYNSYISRGKQTWKQGPFECFYDRTTGIWQTVWVEYVPINGIKSIQFTPNIDTKIIRIEVKTYLDRPVLAELQISHPSSYTHQEFLSITGTGCIELQIPDTNLYLWSPEQPHLYDLNIQLYQNNKKIDEVTSYFAMRKVSMKDGQIYLNNSPYYLRLILDQGYYRDGLLSYPDEETLKQDIILAKQMGFNGCRKHEKIEAERFLYYADIEGFLVSLEMPSAYSFRASDDFVNEWLEIIKRDYNHPSVFMYIPFNESWGVRSINDRADIQDYVTGFYHLTKSIDNTRIVSSNDGWEQTITDVCAIHNYQHGDINDVEKHAEFHRAITDKEALLSNIHTPHKKDIYVGPYSYRKEPILLSEFGGISFANQKQDGWGYTGVSSAEDLERELRRVFDVVYESQHLAGFCYTQLTDVEQEINGLLDYDRKEKLPIDTIKHIVTNKKDNT